jgi:hypothetical protein
MSPTVRLAGIALIGALVVAACQSPPPRPASPPTGRFIADYGPATPEFEDFRAGLIANRFLDTIAARLNDSLSIPKDVTLATARRVTLCYELFKTLSERFRNEVGGDYLVTGTLVFALMHELGHGLIDVLQLPTTGREEDAVDQLATILLLNQGAIGDSLAFGAVGWFATNAQSTRLDDLTMADDHGLDKQRVYNIICWIYGRDPVRYPEVIAQGWLPEHRADQCPAEYQRLRRSWQELLAPYRRGPPEESGKP